VILARYQVGNANKGDILHSLQSLPTESIQHSFLMARVLGK
jgi:hypothetical protein